MKHLLYIIPICMVVFFMACEDVEPEVSGTAKDIISNLSVATDGTDLEVSWTLPSYDEDLDVNIYIDDESAITVEDNPTSYTIENVDANDEVAITVKVSYPDGTLSAGVTEFVTREGTNSISDLSGEWIQEDLEIELSWTLPDSQGGSEILISWTYGIDGSGETTVDASSTSYTIENVEMNTIYAVEVQTQDGSLVSSVVTAEISTPKEWIGTKIGFVIVESDVDDLTDDDEIAAASWFVNNYPEGNVITVADIATGAVDLDDYKVLWLHRDRTGDDASVPAEIIEDDVLTPLTNYLKDGGNMLLSIHATQFLPYFGRIDEDRAPGIIGTGTGSEGTDIWYVNANIGAAYSEASYDHADHAIFNGLEESTTAYTTHNAFPFIGPGIREDHNSMWDLNSYSYATEYDNTILSFEAENEASVLATWGQVTDYCCAGIVEFDPSGEYFGRCIAVGLAAYEWNQNSGTNEYQDNIELFTTNCISYLEE